MIKRITLLVVVLVSIGSAGIAQPDSLSNSNTSENQELTTRQIGLIYSTLGGSGIYYLVPADKNRFRFTGIYIYNDEGATKDSFFSLGVEFQRDLVQDSDKRAYLGIGTSLENTTFLSYADESSSLFNLGAALGLDYGAAQKGLILNLHLSYQLSVGSNETRIGLGGGVGVGFNF